MPNGGQDEIGRGRERPPLWEQVKDVFDSRDRANQEVSSLMCEVADLKERIAALEKALGDKIVEEA